MGEGEGRDGLRGLICLHAGTKDEGKDDDEKEDEKTGTKDEGKDDDEKIEVEKFKCCSAWKEVDGKIQKVAKKIKDEGKGDKTCPEGKPPCKKCHEGAIYDREKKHCA